MKIAIASGKGGTGKTTLSTNLASFIAESRECILTDLDVEEPNSGLFIQGEIIHSEDICKKIPEWTNASCILCGNCQTVCNFNAVLKMGEMVMVFPELCHGCYACSELCPAGSLPMKSKKMGELKSYQSGKLHFIESKLIIGEEQAVPLIKQTLKYVDDNFNKELMQILDSPPGTACPVIEVTRNSDLVILVTEPTPFGLHDLKLTVNTVMQLKKPIAVVVNRHGIGDNKVEEFCKQENIEIIAFIPNDRKIAETYAKGDLLYSVIPSVKDAVEKISNYIDRFKQGNK
ncbi:MAG: ATP-binding protein [Spirochaetia bacterium]|nr:ATP-binding protein [Spirochaetia bacterium]